MPPPDITVRGIRGPIPSGYILGRQSTGTGPPELIRTTDLVGGSVLNAGNLQGTNTNDNARAGFVGEYIEGEVLSGAAISLVAGTPKDIVSISLTPGDWDAWGNIGWTLTGATGNQCFAWIRATSATLPTFTNKGAFINFGGGVVANFGVDFVGQRRFSLATTTTIYLSTQVTFGGSVAAFGFLAARRVR